MEIPCINKVILSYLILSCAVLVFKNAAPPPPLHRPGCYLSQDHFPTFSIFYGVDRLAIDCFLLMFFHSFRRVVTFWLFWCFNLFGFFRFAVASVGRRPDEGPTLDRSKKLFRVDGLHHQLS